jgi:wyosine [tRNA(Phe)-imidazoG37] synthetase (radical SAM superfamily)
MGGGRGAAKPSNDEPALVFGPVPSRRLGRSLGINNIPSKTCSYACVYCQLGRTTRMETEPQPFHAPEEILSAVADRIDASIGTGQSIDALTFVPNGEPTLDARLGESIGRLKELGRRVAVITNGSLLFRSDVREALADADWVSVKVDAATEAAWRRANRPHRRLSFDTVRDGLLRFAEAFAGVLATETMLIEGLNDGDEELERIAAFVGELRPNAAHLAAPIRPPAEAWVRVPKPERWVAAYAAFHEQVDRVETLTADEEEGFALVGAAERSLLEITSVHPMRAEAVEELLERAGEDWSVVEGLVSAGRLVELTHRGLTYYLRRLPGT